MHPLVSLVKPKEVLLPCVDPVLVRQNGRWYAHACGKCYMCLDKKAKIWRARITQEFKDNRFALFFTLTYDNNHVPFARPAEDAPRYILDDAKGFKFPGSDETSYSEKVSAHYSDCGNHVPALSRFDVCDAVGVASRSDVQKFLKRFRYYLNSLLLRHARLKFYDKLFSYTRWLGYNPKSQDFESWLDDLDTETYDLYFDIYNHYKKIYEKEKAKAKQVVRYFICSEYGSHTFRPHYHGFFWFDDEKAYQYATRCIHKAWTLCRQGNIDVQPADSGTASYVTTYVTSFTDLPKILQSKFARPFCLASKGPAIGYKSYSPEKVQRLYLERTIFRSDTTITKQGKQTIVYPIPPSVVCRYFPKCFEYGTLSDVDKLRVYTRFVKYKKVDGIEKVDAAASLACLEWYKKNTKLYPTRGVNELGDTYNVEDSWFHSADVAAARACLRWCIHFDTHPLHYMQMLDWFHYEYAQFQLYQQYQYMDTLYRNAVWPADEYYPHATDVTLYDVQCCIDDAFLRLLPRHISMIDEKMSEYYRIAASYNIPIFSLYDRFGFRRDKKIAELLECNQPHFKKYSDKIKDDLKLHTKSKRANAHVLDSLID